MPGGLKPQIGLSLMPQADFLEAAAPLLAAGEVEVLEWSFDTAWGAPPLPKSVTRLLTDYSQRGCLLGHGVGYSLLSAQWDSASWLDCLAAEVQDYAYRHISEHFGWMRAGNFVQSAPLPMPLLPETVRLGQERLQRLADVAQGSVGLENLAFAFSMRDVLEQGLFLEQLLAPVNGFLLLDLHNLYCQLHNFQQPAAEILARYPLHRVKELHLSGGSWSGAARSIRRDTHDSAIPEPVFALLELALQQCPQVETVIFERLGNTLANEAEKVRFRKDFERIRTILNKHGVKHDGRS